MEYSSRKCRYNDPPFHSWGDGTLRAFSTTIARRMSTGTSLSPRRSLVTDSPIPPFARGARRPGAGFGPTAPRGNSPISPGASLGSYPPLVISHEPRGDGGGLKATHSRYLKILNFGFCLLFHSILRSFSRSVLSAFDPSRDVAI